MKQILFVFFITLLFINCKKQINVDLKNAPSQIVIEGIVSNAVSAEVNISKSVPFSSDNVFPKVSGATVTITDNLGVKYELNETQPGFYTNKNLVGIPGHTYNLNVNIDGKIYEARSQMPQPVNLDTLLFEKIFFGSKSIWIVKPQYLDPPGFGNYYKFIETINGTRFPAAWIWDDRFTNNGISTRPLIQNDSVININDTIEVEMQCIDKNIFRYFTALHDVQHNATTPANPDNNISGGALGYFSAQTSQRKKAVVQ